MFAFLRRRAAARGLHAPLRAAHWDGERLTFELQAGANAPIALDIDGVYFTEVAANAGRCTFRLARSPSGHALMRVLPRLGRDGAPLCASPLRIGIGAHGLLSERAPHAPALQPLAASRCVPFGVEVAAADVAIVVPVYNAPALVERCLDALIAHTTGRARVIVIDDASPDPAIAPLLTRYAGVRGFELLRNERNAGFTASANRGIRVAARADVVLLNADAEVGPNWLVGLRCAAHSDDDVGTVTAVSDNAGAFSVPELEQANPWPAAWSAADAARALWQQAGLDYPELPTGNGFCLYIRRALIDRVGLLDEAAFPQGYGEENDLCQRAARAGFRHLIAGNVFVAHARSQSFGEARRRELGAAGMAVLRERYPHYETEVGAALFSYQRRVLDWRVRRTYAAASAAPLPRLLWVGKDLPAITGAEVWHLRANAARNELVLGDHVHAANTWDAKDAEASYRALWDWLQLFAIERLLVRKRSESVAEILCGLLGIPVLETGELPAAAERSALRDGELALRTFAEPAR